MVVYPSRARRGVTLAPQARQAMAASRERIEVLATSAAPVSRRLDRIRALASRHIPNEQRTQLQRSLIAPTPPGPVRKVEREVVRALMLLRLSTLATGRPVCG